LDHFLKLWLVMVLLHIFMLTKRGYVSLNNLRDYILVKFSYFVLKHQVIWKLRGLTVQRLRWWVFRNLLEFCFSLAIFGSMKVIVLQWWRCLKLKKRSKFFLFSLLAQFSKHFNDFLFDKTVNLFLIAFTRELYTYGSL